MSLTARQHNNAYDVIASRNMVRGGLLGLVVTYYGNMLVVTWKHVSGDLLWFMTYYDLL
jgi:hypothetical protein